MEICTCAASTLLERTTGRLCEEAANQLIVRFNYPPTRARDDQWSRWMYRAIGERVSFFVSVAELLRSGDAHIAMEDKPVVIT